jgi:hypothetical protein
MKIEKTDPRKEQMSRADTIRRTLSERPPRSEYSPNIRNRFSPRQFSK